MIPETLRAFCAWCQREGGPAFLGEREPFDDDSETHGVCRRHLRGILAALPSQSFPNVTYLFVIRPTETSLYDHLERAFLGVPGVKVIMERRTEDRRSTQRRAMPERRRTDRRQPRGTSHALGYTTVRFGSLAGAASSGATSIPV
jgi:hypothetical protein